MSQNHDSPTEQQTEAMKQATAFAYGYAAAMFGATHAQHYLSQCLKLRDDLRLFGCFEEDGIIPKSDYLYHWEAGRRQALQEIEAKNI